MEKIGVEQVEIEDQRTLVKTAGHHKNPSNCEHPKEYIQSDGLTLFCDKCEKYLVKVRNFEGP
jgi:hypothetical protein